jgi:hypothetical protein
VPLSSPAWCSRVKECDVGVVLGRALREGGTRPHCPPHARTHTHAYALIVVACVSCARGRTVRLAATTSTARRARA